MEVVDKAAPGVTVLGYISGMAESKQFCHRLCTPERVTLSESAAQAQYSRKEHRKFLAPFKNERFGLKRTFVGVYLFDFAFQSHHRVVRH